MKIQINTGIVGDKHWVEAIGETTDGRKISKGVEISHTTERDAVITLIKSIYDGWSKTKPL